MQTKTFTSLTAAMSAIKAEQNRDDVRKAENLRKSAPLARNRAKGSGPRIAR